MTDAPDIIHSDETLFITEVESLSDGGWQRKVLHKPTGEYYFVSWCNGITVHERGNLPPEKWKKLTEMTQRKYGVEFNDSNDPKIPPISFSPSTRQSQNRKKTKIGRNNPCPCGSGKKFKKCCGK